MDSSPFLRRWLIDRNFLVLISNIIGVPPAASHSSALLINHLTPNGHFSGRTAPLTYRCCIFCVFNKYTYWIF
jgi:hypothetical protein